MQFSRLSKEASQVLDRDRMIVETIRQHHLPKSQITKTASDIPVLQKIAVIPPHVDQTLEAVAVGTALGDVFASELDMHWVECEDPFDKSLALRFRKTSLVLFPRTMVLKRIRRREEIDVAFLFTAICAAAEQVKHDPEAFLDHC